MKLTGVPPLLACLAPLLACLASLSPALAPFAARAAEINLATLSCDKYENEIVGSSDGRNVPRHRVSTRSTP